MQDMVLLNKPNDMLLLPLYYKFHISLFVLIKWILVDYSEEAYNKVIDQFEEFSSKLLVKDVRFIPISALNGDNVVNRSKNMDWYQGAPLLHTLETMHISSDINKVDARFPVQTVLRPQNESMGL